MSVGKTIRGAGPVTVRAAAGLLSLCGLGAGMAQAEEIRLSPVVVTATTAEQELRDAPATISVVSGDDLRERPVHDMAEALRGVPGITINSIGLGRRGISIRGMPVEHTLMLIDGRRINSAASAIAHADYDLNWVPVEAIERIEVVRGPMSSLYGSDALGGVVNIITRRATDRWKGSVSVKGGVQQGDGGNTYQAGVYAGGPLVQDVLGLSVYAETRGRGETPDAADPRLSELERRAAQTGSATLTWTPDPRQRIDLTLGYGTEEHERNTLQTGTVPYYYTSTDEVERRQFALSHRSDWDWGTSELRAYRTQLDRENIRTQGTPTGPQKLTDDIVDGHVSVPVLGWNTFTFGGEWRREQLEDPTVNSLGSDEANHQAVFLQDQIALSDNLSLLLGSRADRHEEFGWNHSPRAYLVYHLSDELTLKGGVGRGFKAPTLKQLSPGYSASAAGGRFTIVGNPDLNPEINTMYEIGAEYETRGWSLRGSLFQNDLKDLIQTTCIASCGVPRVERRTYGNVERARIRGLELGGGLDLTSWLRFDANYTYLNTENRGTGAELTERPRHAANASLTLFAENGLRARLLSEYVGKQLVSVTSGTEQLPDYAIWSFDIAQPLTDQATLLIGLQNLTDERLAEKTASFPYAEAGRTLWFGLNYSF